MHKIGDIFQVRLTPSQGSQVREIARESGESIASVIRRLVREGLEHESGDTGTGLPSGHADS